MHPDTRQALRRTSRHEQTKTDIMPDEVPNGAAPGTAAVPRRSWWRAAFPFVLTAAITLAVVLGLQQTILRPPSQVIIVPTRQPAPTEIPAPSPQPQPTIATGSIPESDATILRQDLADLRAGQNEIWTAIYLSRAISQISDAEASLRGNDLQSVDQVLIAVDDSLALAYDRADSSVQSPIEQLRRTIDSMRDDLFLYPEQMDERLTRLRQFVLALIEQQS